MYNKLHQVYKGDNYYDEYMPTYVCISLAFICVAAFNIFGSKVIEDGTLVEPFFLIPMMLGVTFITGCKRRKQI